MIRNILFDMGQVLLRFDRQIFLNRLELPETDKTLLLQNVFLGPEWIQLDRGAMDEAEAVLAMQARLPERLHRAAWLLTFQWDKPLLPIPGMYELVEELKRARYGIYLLSNASRRQHVYWPHLPASQFFDGTVISADLGILKPQKEIYLHLADTFGLDPAECFFIDDVQANVEGAQACGMDGFVFGGDAQALREALQKAGVSIHT